MNIEAKEEMVRAAIEAAREVCQDQSFRDWSGGWLSGYDRSAREAVSMALAMEEAIHELNSPWRPRALPEPEFWPPFWATSAAHAAASAALALMLMPPPAPRRGAEEWATRALQHASAAKLMAAEALPSLAYRLAAQHVSGIEPLLTSDFDETGMHYCMPVHLDQVAAAAALIEEARAARERRDREEAYGMEAMS